MLMNWQRFFFCFTELAASRRFININKLLRTFEKIII